jgi:hypothetical protein
MAIVLNCLYLNLLWGVVTGSVLAIDPYFNQKGLKAFKVERKLKKTNVNVKSMKDQRTY